MSFSDLQTMIFSRWVAKVILFYWLVRGQHLNRSNANEISRKYCIRDPFAATRRRLRCDGLAKFDIVVCCTPHCSLGAQSVSTVKKNSGNTREIIKVLTPNDVKLLADLEN